MRRRLATTLLCAAACAGPLIGGSLPATLPVAVLLALLGKALLLDPREGALAPRPLAVGNLFFWLYFGWATLLGGINAQPFEVALAFGLFFLLLRSLAAPSHYNDFLLLLGSLCVLLGSVDAAPGWLPLPITGLYLAAAAFAVSIRRPGGAAGRDAVRVRLLPHRAAWRLVPPSLVLGLALSGLLLGTLLYLFVPRRDRSGGDGAIPPEAETLAAGRAGRLGSGGATSVTGFPTTVRVGDIGRIKQDERIAFLAELRVNGVPHDPPPDQRTMLLLRARAWLDYEPGEGLWRRPSAARRRLDSGTLDAGGDPTVDWNFSLRAYEGHVLFLPQRAMRIRASDDALLIDDLGTVTSQREIRRYGVEAASPPPSHGLVADRSDARLLAVPPSLRPALAARLGESRAAPGVAEAVETVRRYFERHRFRYTLSLPPEIGASEEPLLAFLDAREGHCELYATAGCLLLRSLGIPARLAGGLRLSERLDQGLYQARFKNAHAWVEVACLGVGMVAVDFTPADSSAVAPVQAAGGEVPRAPRQQEVEGARGGRSEALDWRRPFEYGVAQQQALARTIAAAWKKIPWAVVLPVALALLLLPLLPRLLRRRPPGPLAIRPPPGVPRRALAFYARWLKACARRGHLRRRNQTPREFLASLPPDLREPGGVVTAEFERLRYGGGGRLPA